jgi:regulator of RNase E activity RraA
MCLCLLGALLVTTATRSAEDAKGAKGICSGLKVGQSVSLKDEGPAFTITFFEPDLPQSHKVIEIGDNFVVVRDIAGITETTVPVYSVKAIVKARTNKP